MTLAEIRRRTREQTGGQYEIDAQGDPMIDDYINEGMREICGLRMPREASVVVRDGKFKAGDAADGFGYAIKLTDAAGSEVAFESHYGYIYAKQDGKYTLYYAGSPEAMRQDGDVAPIPEGYHGALADYASWRILALGGAARQARAQYFFARYQLAQMSVGKWLDGQMGKRRIRNKYR
ncbi:MAG: hypothetical protein RSD95_10260 [Clostridia bacterium]